MEKKKIIQKEKKPDSILLDLVIISPSTLINWTMKLTFFQFLHLSFQTLNHHTRLI